MLVTTATLLQIISSQAHPNIFNKLKPKFQETIRNAKWRHEIQKLERGRDHQTGSLTPMAGMVVIVKCFFISLGKKQTRHHLVKLKLQKMKCIWQMFVIISIKKETQDLRMRFEKLQSKSKVCIE